MAPPTVPGVPAHASRPAMPRLIVHRTSPLIVNPASARIRASDTLVTSPPCTLITTPRIPASAINTLEPPPSTVTGDVRVVRHRHRRPDLRRVSRLHQPVGWSANLECSERRERRIAKYPIGPNGAAKADADVGHVRAPVSAASTQSQRRERILARAGDKFDPVARDQLSSNRQVRGDHVRDRGITSGRLTIGHQQDRLTRCWYLDDADAASLRTGCRRRQRARARARRAGIPSGWTAA